MASAPATLTQLCRLSPLESSAVIGISRTRAGDLLSRDLSRAALPHIGVCLWSVGGCGELARGLATMSILRSAPCPWPCQLQCPVTSLYNTVKIQLRLGRWMWVPLVFSHSIPRYSSAPRNLIGMPLPCGLCFVLSSLSPLSRGPRHWLKATEEW